MWSSAGIEFNILETIPFATETFNATYDHVYFFAGLIVVILIWRIVRIIQKERQ